MKLSKWARTYWWDRGGPGAYNKKSQLYENIKIATASSSVALEPVTCGAPVLAALCKILKKIQGVGKRWKNFLKICKNVQYAVQEVKVLNGGIEKKKFPILIFLWGNC